MLNVVNLTAVKIMAPVKRLQTKTQVNTRKFTWFSAYHCVHCLLPIFNFLRCDNFLVLCPEVATCTDQGTSHTAFDQRSRSDQPSCQPC